MFIETFITCWIFLLADGSLYCQCEGDPDPPATAQVVAEIQRPKPEIVELLELP